MTRHVVYTLPRSLLWGAFEKVRCIMSKRKLLEMQEQNMAGYRMMSMAVAIAMVDDIDDDVLLAGGIKRPRVHAFWMSPFLKARTDPTQRNTLAKLEADFIRVSILITHYISSCMCNVKYI